MKASLHKDYLKENNHLQNTIENLILYIKELDSFPLAGGDDWAKFNLARFNRARKDKYASELESPYFIRVDYLDESQEKIISYIGYRLLPLGEYEVINWRAPLGSLISAKRAGLNLIISPTGPRNVYLSLKRRFLIKRRVLISIKDKVRERQLTKNAENKLFGIGEPIDRFLLENLYSRGDIQLKDIVKTIQDEQNELIRYKPNTTLIINGVAGSGKSSIAIHRVSVLLYLHKETIEADRTILFCPNRIFLNYIKDLLPFLGDNAVIQTTFNDWALENIGLSNHKYTDSSIEIFSDPAKNRKVKRLLWKRAQLKSNLKIKDLVEKIVENKIKNIRIPVGGLSYNNVGPLNLHFAISQQNLKNIFDKSLANHKLLDERRNIMLIELIGFFQTQYDEQVWREINSINVRVKRKKKELAKTKNLGIISQLNEEISMLENEEKAIKGQGFYYSRNKAKTIEEIKKSVEKDFKNIWPEFDIYKEYYCLITNFNLLQKAGTNIYSHSDIKTLVSKIPANDCVEIEDIPALFYLKKLVSPIFNEGYDHIVIDEGQDFSVAQYDILKNFSKNGSFTIVGDIHQGINSHRGLSRWDELKPVFSNITDFQIKNVNICYRSTREITLFANRILRKLGVKKDKLPIPYNRKGKRVFLSRVRDQNSLKEKVLDEIIRIRQKSGYKNIAVITKDFSTYFDLYSFLESRNIKISHSSEKISAKEKYEGGLIILPISIAKGMEFQAVIVVNVDKENFSLDVPYDGRLLYVAVTRALHYLSLVYYGTKSMYLQK